MGEVTGKSKQPTPIWACPCSQPQLGCVGLLSKFCQEGALLEARDNQPAIQELNSQVWSGKTLLKPPSSWGDRGTPKAVPSKEKRSTGSRGEEIRQLLFSLL